MDRSADRISQLPDVILHHILSLLKPEDAFSAACLSKSWLNVWLTCPDLTFRFYSPHHPRKNISYKFKKFVENTISRFSESELSVRSLRIKVHLFYDLEENASSLLAKSIEFSVEKQVEILHVNGYGRKCIFKLDLPKTICETIFTAKSLIELELRHCSLTFIDRMFLLATKYGQFNNLKRLIFDDVCLLGYFDKLFCNIPLIEDIEICYCELQFNKLRVSNVPKLKRFKLHWSTYEICNYIYAVEIAAPSLESFDNSGFNTLNMDAFQNLKRLKLSVQFETLKSFNSFSTFMFLEFLMISDKYGSMNSNYNISSQSLKHVRLILSSLTLEVMIDAPNLLLLEYAGCGCNSITFRNPPKQLKVTLSGCLDEDYKYNPPAWFLRVRSSLMKLGNRTKIDLSLHAHDMQKCFVSIKGSEEVPEPEVEHLALYRCDGPEVPSYARGDAHRTLDEVIKAVEKGKGVFFMLKWSS